MLPFKHTPTKKELLTINPKKLKIFRDILNEKKYRVADTGLSYRKINSLGGNKILIDNRNDGRGWRKFSYKELLVISIIKELRLIGFIDEKLENLRDLFFKKTNENSSDFAIMLAHLGIKTTLIITFEDKGFIYDLVGFEIKKDEGRKSYISVNINKIIEELRKTTGEINMDMNEIIIHAKNKDCVKK